MVVSQRYHVDTYADKIFNLYLPIYRNGDILRYYYFLDSLCIRLLLIASNDEVCGKYFLVLQIFKRNWIKSNPFSTVRLQNGGKWGRCRFFKIFAKRPLPTYYCDTCDMCRDYGDWLYDTMCLCTYVTYIVGRKYQFGVHAEASVKWLRDMKSTCIRIGNEVKSTLVQMKYLQIMDFIIWNCDVTDYVNSIVRSGDIFKWLFASALCFRDIL